ncbi:hypothetical protein DDI74_01095 [Chryseobacterium gleum]|nr:hypothetical protein DDI74_01095 [Chryseobacterium gleum]
MLSLKTNHETFQLLFFLVSASAFLQQSTDLKPMNCVNGQKVSLMAAICLETKQFKINDK